MDDEAEVPGKAGGPTIGEFSEVDLASRFQEVGVGVPVYEAEVEGDPQITTGHDPPSRTSPGRAPASPPSTPGHATPPPPAAPSQPAEAPSPPPGPSKTDPPPKPAGDPNKEGGDEPKEPDIPRPAPDEFDPKGPPDWTGPEHHPAEAVEDPNDTPGEGLEDGGAAFQGLGRPIGSWIEPPIAPFVTPPLDPVALLWSCPALI